MSKKLNNKSKNEIDAEQLHSFFTNFDKVFVNYTDIINYATQLSVLIRSYYDIDCFDREIICNCIFNSVNDLYDTVYEIYNKMSVCDNMLSDIFAKNG